MNYADDFVILCRGTAAQAMTAMRDMMQRLKLTVNETKTHVCRVPTESFDFLGYTFGRCYSTRTGRAYLGSYTSVDDATLRHIHSIKTLEELDLSGTKITDQALADLKELSDLQSLFLRETSITDAGVAHLKQFRKLRKLSLCGTQTTDESLRHLSSLKDLRTLLLVGTGVTDEGLMHLHGLKLLNEVWLEQTSVNAEGIRELQQALPGCTIRTALQQVKYSD